MSYALVRRIGMGVLAAALCAGALGNDGAPALRYQKDPSRNREWMLTSRGVTVFDNGARRTVTLVELPQWVWAGEAHMCPPDLALGPKGEALVTSNVVASLWRIDPVSLHVTRHDLVVDAHVDKDVGFTGLAYSAELGAFFAISDFGALWRIDPLLRRAQEITLDQPVRRACSLSVPAPKRQARTPRLWTLCAHDGATLWSIHLAPDQRSGYVARGRLSVCPVMR